MHITEELYKQIITDVNSFNKFLSDYKETIMQQVILEIPNMVLYHISETQKLNKLREKFYKENPSLKDQKGLLVQTVNSITNKHPEWDREKVYKETGLKATKILSMESSNEQGF